jgi:hypothetical protein
MSKLTLVPSKPARPVFHSQGLQDALAESGDCIDQIATNLDHISEDIKNLEGYLAASGVRLSARHSFNTSIEPWDKCYESIEWAEHTSGRWRILYRKTPAFSEEEYGEMLIDGEELPKETICPLIEAPAVVRIRAYHSLRELLQEVGKLATKAVPPIQVKTDIPF